MSEISLESLGDLDDINKKVESGEIQGINKFRMLYGWFYVSNLTAHEELSNEGVRRRYFLLAVEHPEHGTSNWKFFIPNTDDNPTAQYYKMNTIRNCIHSLASVEKGESPLQAVKNLQKKIAKYKTLPQFNGKGLPAIYELQETPTTSSKDPTKKYWNQNIISLNKRFDIDPETKRESKDYFDKSIVIESKDPYFTGESGSDIHLEYETSNVEVVNNDDNNDNVDF